MPTPGSNAKWFKLFHRFDSLFSNFIREIIGVEILTNASAKNHPVPKTLVASIPQDRIAVIATPDL